MGMARVQELAGFLKDSLQKTAAVAKGLSIDKLSGPSMLPTLDHNIALSESVSVRQGEVGSGDIVIIRSPENPVKLVAKRMKAVEGDAVTYALHPKSRYKSRTVVVPKEII